jgi:Flp pilus assembly protein TadD
MKKIKKRLPPSRRHNSSAQSSRTTDKPSESFIHEMATLFNAQEFGLLEQKANEAIRRWPRHSLGWKALGNLLLMQGRPVDAMEPLLNSVKLAPNDAQAQHNLGSAFLELGRFGEAEARYRQALAIKPEYAQAHSNLGIVFLKLGRFEEAEASYRRALKIKPDFAEAHNNLGNALKELKRFEEAESCYQQALVLKPDFAEAHSNLGNIFLERKRFGEAEASYRQALLLKPDYAKAHSGLGDALLRLGRLNDAIVSYRKGIDLDTMEIKAQNGLNHALSQLIPLWHVPMMNDRHRNDAYFAALCTAITSDTHVLEIGTGSGLLAMMAAKLGAWKVTTCEAVSEIADIARVIVAENGFTPPVTVVSKMSTKIVVGTDMDDRADLLVSEILSSEFLGEGVLSSIEDAKCRLLKPGARIIPARGSIQFALFGGSDIEQNIRVDNVYGFDLSKFNTIIAQKQYLSRNDLNIELLTDDTCAFTFDFVENDRFPANERQIFEIPVRKAGRCCGIIQWIRLEMDDTVVFENHPSIKNLSSSWQQCIYSFPTAIDLLPGQVAVISAAHNRNTPWFFFEGLT